jgi:hypothetical protein
LAFADTQHEAGGLARDLVIDYARISYSKGTIVELTMEKLGFWPFPHKPGKDHTNYFWEFVDWNHTVIE